MYREGYVYMEDLYEVSPVALLKALNDRLIDWSLPPLTKQESIPKMIWTVFETLQYRDVNTDPFDFFEVRLSEPSSKLSFCLWSGKDDINELLGSIE